MGVGTGDQVEEFLRARLAAADHANALASQVLGPARVVADMEIPASEMSADVSWDARLYPNADRDIVGCDHHRARRDPESVPVFDGENLLAEYDILVLTAGPVHVIAKFLTRHRFKLRV